MVCMPVSIHKSMSNAIRFRLIFTSYHFIWNVLSIETFGDSVAPAEFFDGISDRPQREINHLMSNYRKLKCWNLSNFFNLCGATKKPEREENFQIEKGIDRLCWNGNWDSKPLCRNAMSNFTDFCSPYKKKCVCFLSIQFIYIIYPTMAEQKTLTYIFAIEK